MWISSYGGRKHPAKHGQPHQHKGHEHEAHFLHLRQRPMHTGVLAPEQQDRGHNECAARISHPPGEPDASILGPIGVAAEGQAGHPEEGACRRACQCRESSKFEDILRTVKGVGAVGKPVHQVGAGEPFEGVPRRDAKRGRDGPCRGEVDEKRAQEDAGPDAIAQQ